MTKLRALDFSPIGDMSIMHMRKKELEKIIMPRPRPPYLLKEHNRHGTIVWYVRIDRGLRIRIRGEYGSPEFNAAYQAAITGEMPQRGPAEAAGSLTWLIARYRETQAWAALSRVTQRARDNIHLQVIKTAGDIPFTQITSKKIHEGLDHRRATPFSANCFLKAMRSLFRWAKASGHLKDDPTLGIRGHIPRSDGYHVWTEAEIEQFETRWPVGTKERLALAILLYTGLRRGDAARLGRPHVRDGVIMIRTEKTGIQIVIPMLPELAAIIAATKTGDLAFLATEEGRPMAKNYFGCWFRGACKAAGVPGSAHGLRKAGATRAANNGATVAQLEAIYGWSDGGKMAALYTKQADRVKLAREAMGMLRKEDDAKTKRKISSD